MGCWSAGVGQEREPFKGSGDLAGPGPVPGEAENPAPTSGDELAGGREQQNLRRRGSQSRALPVRAGMDIQASRSSAIWTISSQLRQLAVAWGSILAFVDLTLPASSQGAGTS